MADTNALAGRTARIALSPIVEHLQGTKRRINDLETPCKEAVDLQAATTTYMDFVVSAYFSFMTDRPDVEVKRRFEQADEALQESMRHYTALSAYVPESSQ